MKNLTKTKYVRGVRCLKALYLNEYKSELGKKSDEAQKMIMEQGREVGNLAKEQFNGGIEITWSQSKGHVPKDFQKEIAATKEALKQNIPAIFEATFFYKDILVKVDILEKTDGGWNLIEVKSSTEAKEEHIDDATIQYFVLRGCGIKLSGVFIMYVNKSCIFPDLSNFFVKKDISDEVEKRLVTVEKNVKKQLKVLAESSEPNVDIGTYCDEPRECEFKSHCWKHIKENSVFELYRLSRIKKFELYYSGIAQIGKLPKVFPLSPIQERQVETVKTGKPYIDADGIRIFFNQVEYPVHYLDFETANPAIPLFDGMHPYQHIPFQFSCSVRGKDGKLLHREFLKLGKEDPREELLQSLLNSIDNKGTIFVFNQKFEKGRLKELSEAFPKYEKKIENLMIRIVDMLDIFSAHYYHPDFHGSMGLKNIVPVITPDLSYAGMDISEGGSASAAYIKVFKEHLSEVEVSVIQNNLLKYCQKDTLALVKIHDFFLNMTMDTKKKKYG